MGFADRGILARRGAAHPDPVAVPGGDTTARDDLLIALLLAARARAGRSNGSRHGGNPRKAPIDSVRRTVHRGTVGERPDPGR